MSSRLFALFLSVMVVLCLGSRGTARAETIATTARTDGDGRPLCLDVLGGQAAKGTDLILYRCHGGANQSFRFFPDSGEIRSDLGNFCVDVDQGKAAPGNRVQLWECNGTNAQKFDFDPRTERLTFRAKRSLCVDVPDGGTARLSDCNGSSRQRFDVVTKYGKARFDELTSLTSHNAFANSDDSNWAVPNQSRGISRSLEDGVRGFMLDLHSFESGTARCVLSFGSDCYDRDIYLCHGDCGGVPGVGYALPRQTLVGSLQKIVDFLKRNPEEIVTVFFEDYVGTGELSGVFDRVPGLRELMFDPYAWNVQQNGWPRASALVHANDRLLFISDRSDKRSLGVGFAQDLTVENYWSMGGLDPDYACRSRWDHIGLDRSEPRFNRLFVMNHFRDVAMPVSAGIDNQHDSLTTRIESHCVPAAKRKPNYLAVDFYDRSDARGVAAEVNDASAILFEHGNFEGRAQLLGRGVYHAEDLSVGNDRVSSVRVLPGTTVVLFEHNQRSGRSRTLYGSAAGVGDMNDLTSSVLVLRDDDVRDSHLAFGGDFDGDGKSDRLIYHATTGDLLLGRSNGSALSWSTVGNISGFGSMFDGRHEVFAGDVTGDGKTDLLFYFSGDGNWWLGRSQGTGFGWGIAATTQGFGNLLGTSHRRFQGDFNGDGKEDVAFYYAANGDVWFGLSNGTGLTFHRAGNLASFGSLLDDDHAFMTADFTGDAKTDLAFYDARSGDIWLGRSDGTNLTVARAANTAGLGNLLSDDRARLLGDFDGDGKTDFAFYYAANGDFWLGRSDGTNLNFARLDNAGGFGSLLDASRTLFQGDFDGNGTEDVGFHYAGNGDTWLGLSSGTRLTWRRASTVTNDGNLLDAGRTLRVADFDGDGKDDLETYAPHTGQHRIGRSTGQALEWRDAGVSASFGDFTR